MPVPENLTDEQLIVGVREIDKEFYSEIIRRYQTKLSHYLRKFIKSGDELEDVLQDVFIKAYRNLYDFDVGKKFSPWIYRIAHNEALNHVKKYRRESVSLDDQELEIFDEGFDIKETVDRTIARERIESALLKIKDRYREPIILYFFEQKTYEEIGDILRLPRNTVGTLVSRGKKLLKQLLATEKYDRK
ncbi:MAG: RNA polymerase sigma factor [Candidatus Magasanikbacteria bacterium]|nr:RNA polymerase sigma factor [Candidatus Magasanikbacteria bacterium]